jgi:hypothetical protein
MPVRSSVVDVGYFLLVFPLGPLILNNLFHFLHCRYEMDFSKGSIVQKLSEPYSFFSFWYEELFR